MTNSQKVFSNMLLWSTFLGALFGTTEWFYPIKKILYQIFDVQSALLVYFVWTILPTIITVYTSFRTRRALISYIQTNIFLLTAISFYYASYVFDLLFLNNNDLLRNLHYDTIDWPVFFGFVIHDIGSKIVEWTAIALALGLVLGLIAMTIVGMLDYVAKSRSVQQ